MHTTLAAIRACGPCASGWTKLLAHLGKSKADDEPLAVATILDSNGIEDALWALRAVEGHDREKRLYAVWCARRVEHLLTDQRSRDVLDVAERFANGRASIDELRSARAAAAYAAFAAVYVSADAAFAADAADAAAAFDAVDAAAPASGQSAELRRVCAAIDAGVDPYPPAPESAQ